MVVRAGAGAVALSAGILLGALAVPAVAHAAPDTESTASADDGSAARGERPSRPPARGSRPGRGSSAGVDVPRDRRESLPVADEPVVPVLVPESVDVVEVPRSVPAVLPAAVDVVAPVAVSDPVPVDPPVAPVAVVAPVALPEPPRLAGAVPLAAAESADALAAGAEVPLPSALAWTMLAAARSEVGRRSPGAGAVVAGLSTSDPVQPVGQAVSPLGTPEQLAAEAAAMETVQTLPMLVSKAMLNLAWRVIGCVQYGQVGGPDKENLDALSQAVDEWAMGTGFQLGILNSNEPTIVMQVAPPHQWYGLDVTGSRILYDNPDTIYRFVGVNYASQYVITGRLPERDPQASFSVLTGTTGTTVAVLNGDQLELGPDRSFVVTVSGEPAAPGEANHLQITPDTTLIAIRDTLSDWNTQEPMSLAIHRVAGPPNSLFSQFGGFAIPFIGPLVAQSPFLTAVVSLIPPLPAIPPFVRGSLASLLMLRGIGQESEYIQVATVDPVTGKPKAPNVFTDPASNASFLATQLQSPGYFQLADDQALVLTITPNNAGYFVVPVTNDWTITDNYWDEQTSLNSSQALANPDGSYTLVVSPVEPVLAGGKSVWNWVSTGGLNQGTIAIRFQDIDLTAAVNPTVHSQVVALSDLESVLPAGTTVVTPAERAAQIALRKQGFDRRFAPYPQTA